LWLALLVAAAATLLVQALYQQVLASLVEGGPFAWIVRATLYYFIYFLFGAAGFANRRFFERLHGFGPVAAAVLVVMMAVQYQAIGWRAQSPSALSSAVFWVSRAAITMLLLSALLTLFRKWFDRSSPARAFLVDAAYSFYLFHVAVIYLIAIPVFRWSGDLYLTFAAVVLLGVPLLLLWHGLVIRRVPLLRLVFNGKRPRPQPAPGRVAA
jgi:peptidoglycan/LPS O-acetylase OafA/YrhL